MGLALVTGASRGIGRAIALALARAGHDIIGTYKSQKDAADVLATEISALGKKCTFLAVDVADGPATEAAITKAVEEHGCPDILVNNAGITKDTLFAMMGRDTWDSVINTNLGGFYSVTRPIVRQMLRRRSGRIINISSVLGQRGNAGQVNYSASKAGLIGATKALALEVAPRGITVNAVAPGLIQTDMLAGAPVEKIVEHIPMGRLGTPEEIAGVVVFLSSAEASYITGQVIGVNGGLYT